MALSKTVHPHDRTRFVRLSLVILEELTPLLQDILENEILPTQILNQVSQQKQLFEKLGAEQTIIIQNAQTNGYKNFDITLLYTLLRNLKCLKVASPTQGWGTSQMPGNGETTLGDDIERIRLIRNKIYGHASEPSLSETEFQEHWCNISDICKRMQTLLGKKYVESLQRAEVRAIDRDMENTYLQKIQSMCIAEKSTRELLQQFVQDKAHCVEENVRIETRNPRKRKFAQILTDTSISILNEIKDCINEMTPDSDIKQIYEVVDEFIRENKENIQTLTSFPFFEELEQKIKRYAYLKTNRMQILIRHFHFILKLKKTYSAELESSEGSLLLKLTFSSERGCDLYLKDLERGEIGKRILSLLLYPPYLANFDLHAEDLMIYLNNNELTAEIMLTSTSEMLHPQHSAQDVIPCDLCEAIPLQSHCERCDVNLCMNCVGKHLSDFSRRHNVVHYLHRKSTLNYSKCSKHADQHYQHYCENCDIPVCITCVSSGEHKGHELSDILEILSVKTESLQKDLEELETTIYYRYEVMTSDVQTERVELETNYGKLITAADQQGEVWHREITAIVNQRKSDIQRMKDEHLSILNKHADEITQKITELKQVISDLKSKLKSNDVFLTLMYESRISEFRTLPPKVQITLPSFTPRKLKKDQLNDIFGSLSSLSIKTEHAENITPTMKSAEAVSSPPVKSLLDEPRLTATIDTGYTDLYSVRCLNEEEIWTCWGNEIVKLINLKGNLLTSMQTKSGNAPWDIAVTRDGDLVYTDPGDKSINLLKNNQIHTVIKLQGWIPRNVCSTSSDDLLVTMISDDETQCKVVRYSGSTEKQTIQFDDQGCPLYSSGYHFTKYISENRNLDICVAEYMADCEASAVVVVNQSGKLRFRYTGHPFNTMESFRPVGITTDSQSHIMTTDPDNHRIHILDQDGQFLRYIHCHLERPWSLCVDNRDNLFVAERDTAKMKKIQYLETQR